MIFDKIIDRTNTASLKWDRYGEQDILPLWVADMDFSAPPAVIQALQRRVEHGIFGYTLPPKELYTAVCDHVHKDFDWEINPDWIVWLPGVVPGLVVSCRAVGTPGDDVLTTTPVYPPFLSAPGQAERNLVPVPLLETETRWEMDFTAMEQAITPRSSLLLLCSPHNPVGRAYTREELLRVAEFCKTHNLVVCSDEIHAGLILDENRRHLTFAATCPDMAERTITLLAPSKTFNIPGLGCAFAIIPNRALRSRFRHAMEGIVPHVNLFGYTAALAAYRDSSDWHRALLDYLRDNRTLVQETMDHLPGLRMTHVEATYLAWIDTRSSGIREPTAFFEQAGVGLSDGAAFGTSGFVRLNFGCPRSLLQKALLRMETALKGRSRD